jgi:hypothetical protein
VTIQVNKGLIDFLGIGKWSKLKLKQKVVQLMLKWCRGSKLEKLLRILIQSNGPGSEKD